MQTVIANRQTHRRTILLVEDEPFVRDATRTILESCGFSVLAAANGCDAIRLYEQFTGAIDLVMTDMVLPGRTGQQIGEDLRQRSPQLKVLITSGYGIAEETTEDPAADTYFLAKPYSRHGLIDKIENIFNPQMLQPTGTQAR
jgi:two-component system, cell cycle sensor histidine kinase and response regulator CckA